MRETITFAISLCAFFISALGFYLTYSSDRRDAFYKELGVRPYLVVRRSSYSTEWSVENAGVGPAVIDHVVLAGPNGCFRSAADAKDATLQEEYYKTIDKEIYKDFGGDLPKGLPDDGSAFKTTSRHHYIESGEVIAPSKHITMFSTAVEYFKPRVEIVKDFKTDIDHMVRDRFSKAIRKYDGIIYYCSSSMKWCGATNTETSIMKKCEPKYNLKEDFNRQHPKSYQIFRSISD